MKPAFNRLANQYLVLGCATLFSAIAALLAIRISVDLLFRYGKTTMIFLVVQMVAGFAMVIAGLTRRLKTVEILGEAEPLCAEHIPGAVGQPRPAFSYKALDLKGFLKAGARPVYLSSGLSDRLLYQFFPDILSCSPVLQNAAREHFLRAFTAALTCCLFLLMIVSTFLGLYGNHENSSVKWTALLYFSFLSAHSVIPQRNLSAQRVVTFVVCAIFVPLVVSFIAPHLPVINNWIFVCLAISAALPVMQLWAFFGFLRGRLALINAQSRATTRAMRFQGPLAPEAVYQHFTSAFNREASSVNRCYQNDRRDEAMPGAFGSGRAGTVSGELLFESDPVHASSAAVATDRWGWIGVAVALAGVCTLYLSIDPSVWSISLLVASLTMIIYGIRSLRTAEFFSTECLFESIVASFSLEGTYDTARLATAVGAQTTFHKQHESPNVDVSITLICAKLVSSVFAKPGEALPFQNAPRYILAFGETARFADALVEDLAGKVGTHNSLEAVRISFTGPALPQRNEEALPSAPRSFLNNSRKIPR